MTAKQIYSSTKKFPTRLLLLNIACAAAAIVLFAIFFGISLITGSGGLLVGGIIASVTIYGIASGIVSHYIGYMFKYGAVHAVAMAHCTGHVSSTYFDDSVEYIKSGFLKANAYFVVDKLVSSAVRGVTRLANFILGFLPDNIKDIVDKFIDIYLNYIDECCLGWSMIHANENVIKTSCDGVVIYYQNAKKMLSPAAKTTLRVVIVNIVIFIVGCVFMFFPPLAVVFWLIAYAAVTPYLNHRILCETMVAYLDCASTTEINVDLYDKLSHCKPFKKLVAKMEDPEFDPAPGNEGIDISVMKEATRKDAEERAFSETADKNEPAKIPDPPRRKPTQDQILWQQAWGKMSAEQRKTYNSMDAEERAEWKRQILKELFGYDGQ